MPTVYGKGYEHEPQGNQLYPSVREELERETNDLLNDRKYLHLRKPSELSPSIVYQEQPLRHPRGDPNKRSVDNKTSAIRNGIQDVIALCQNQNVEVGDEFQQILQAERSIVELLKRAHTQGEQLPQLRTPLSEKPPQQPMTKPPRNEYHQPPQQRQPTKGVSLKNIIRSSKNLPVDDHLIQAIQESEATILEELESLRQEKIFLMKRLNEEIRNVNNERKRSIALENELQQYKDAGIPKGGVGFSSHNIQSSSGINQQTIASLQFQIMSLEKELQRERSQSETLRTKISSQGSNQEIEHLLRQGEAIRQETLRLLREKQNGGSVEVRQLKAMVEELREENNRLRTQPREGFGTSSYQRISPIRQFQKPGYEQLY